eukprot:2431145-Alexandrium_andersonii.AAC.1
MRNVLPSADRPARPEAPSVSRSPLWASQGALTYEETEQVRLGTYFTRQSVKAATLAVETG